MSCSKGIVLESGQLISEVVKEVLGKDANYAVLSGPTFAAEIMKKCKHNHIYNSSYFYCGS